jgi:glyoxylase-like metal-dependent hydrolase (beta-lactamase superfamily II)
MKKTACLFFLLLIVLAIGVESTTAQSITKAGAALKAPGAVAPFVNLPDPDPLPPTPFGPLPYPAIAPIKLFDNLYFVGTTAVGAFVIDTGDGLAMLDAGLDNDDAAKMTEDMKKLGLNPSKIKLILISHDHFDHYGGVQYLKKNVCPKAKVAMSLIGWNFLQTVPLEAGYINPRPQAVDIYLTDGMKIKMGNTTFQIVATPGHSAGCVSFIIPVKDNGKAHMAGIMGGTGVWATQLETRLYKASIEYFKAFATAAKCDVGLGVHSTEPDFAAVRVRKPGEAHPLVIGTVKFDTVYLQKYRDLYQYVLDSGKMQPYPGVVAPPGSAPARQ